MPGAKQPRKPAGAEASTGGQYTNRDHPDDPNVTLQAAPNEWARSTDRPDADTYQWPRNVPRERAIVAYDDEHHLYTFGSGTTVDTWPLPSRWIDTHILDVGAVAAAGLWDRLDVHTSRPFLGDDDAFELTSSYEDPVQATVYVGGYGKHWASMNGHGEPIDLRTEDASRRLREAAVADKLQRDTARAIERELAGNRGTFARHCSVFPTYRDERGSLSVIAGAKQQFREALTFDADGTAHLSDDTDERWTQFAKWARVPRNGLRERVGECRRAAMETAG